jgi:hypothetical protein
MLARDFILMPPRLEFGVLPILFTWQLWRYVNIYEPFSSLTPVKLLDGIGVFKGRIRRNADPYQVDIATPLDRSFDEDAGGDEDHTPELLDLSESDDDLCASVTKVDLMFESDDSCI